MDYRTYYIGCSHLFKIFCHMKILQTETNNFKQKKQRKIYLYIYGNKGISNEIISASEYSHHIIDTNGSPIPL